MNRNREEAVIARRRAEEQMQRGDFLGARSFVVKAMHLFPELDNLLQILTVCNVHCSSLLHSDTRFPDWYGVLGTDRKADKSVFRKQYHKLALLLHPDKNKFPGAEAAFKLVGEANLLLSDPVRRMIYDSSAFSCIRDRPHSPPFSGGTDNTATFVTCCPFCNFTSRNHRCFMNAILRCYGCSKTFIALDIFAQSPPSPATFSPDPPYAFPATENATGPPPQTSPDISRHHQTIPNTPPPPIYRDSSPMWRQSVKKCEPSGSKRKKPCGKHDVSSVEKLPAVKKENDRNDDVSSVGNRPPGGKDDVTRTKKVPAVKLVTRSKENDGNDDVSSVRNRPPGGKDDVTPIKKPPVVKQSPRSRLKDNDGNDDISSVGNRPPGGEDDITPIKKLPAVKQFLRSRSKENDDVSSVRNRPPGGKDDVTPIEKPPAVEQSPRSRSKDNDGNDDVSSVGNRPPGGEDDVTPIKKLPAVKQFMRSRSKDNDGNDDVSSVENRPPGGKDDVTPIKKLPVVKQSPRSRSKDNDGNDDVSSVGNRPPGGKDDLSSVKNRPPGGKDDVTPIKNLPAVKQSPRSRSKDIDGNHDLSSVGSRPPGGKDDVTHINKLPAVKQSPRYRSKGNGGNYDVSSVGNRPPGGKDDVTPIKKLPAVKQSPRSRSKENDGSDDVSSVGNLPAVGNLPTVGNLPAVENPRPPGLMEENNGKEDNSTVEKLSLPGSKEGGEGDVISYFRNPPAVEKRRPRSSEKDDISPVGIAPAVKKAPTSQWKGDDENDHIGLKKMTSSLSGSAGGEKDDIIAVEKQPAAKNASSSEMENGVEDDITPAGKSRAVKELPFEPEENVEDDISPAEKPPSLNNLLTSPSKENGNNDDISLLGKPPAVRNPPCVTITPPVEKRPSVKKRPAVKRLLPLSSDGGKDDISPRERDEKHDIHPFRIRPAVKKHRGNDDFSPKRLPDRAARPHQNGAKRQLADKTQKTPENPISKPVQTVFHDFSTDRTDDKFKVGQIWAVLHGPDRPPPPRYVRVDQLEPSPAGLRVQVVELGTGVGPASSFEVFRAGPTHVLEASDFSHLVEADPDEDGRYDIMPRKGEVWAFRDGSEEHQVWRVVEVWDCTRGCTKVKRLHQVCPGRSVFKERTGARLFTVHQKDMWGFSHRIPAFRLNLKSESLGRCWELDPATLPDCD